MGIQKQNGEMSLGEKMAADIIESNKHRELVMTILLPHINGWQMEKAIDALEYCKKQCEKLACINAETKKTS